MAFGAEVNVLNLNAVLPVGKEFHVRDYPHILISGEVVASDVKKVRDLLPRLKQAKNPTYIPLVFLNSPGGDLIAAMQIGGILRSTTAWLVVDSGANCFSACIFVLAAGMDRWVLDGSRLGIHRPYFDPKFFGGLDVAAATSRYEELSRRAREYLRTMEMSDELFSDMLQVPSNRIRIIDSAYAERMRLVGSDPGLEEWRRSRLRNTHGEKFVQQLDRYLECLNTGIGRSECDTRFPTK